ncbi:peptide ABC transporter ATP-binding protein [Fusobacterium necrophorum subsp. funduliforme]|uniref:Oligopeptide/dipeptide transporter, C-terminal domain protein n=7 Tax=Fusobacterium TaxID=848 RepID=A0AAN4ARZ5_9FUSO|nr:oligopeptide/dipeptide ABC transporter ATP-binding protein [Fusobacterium necrophorum]AYV94804.1 ATP-binding cassette domain-containing protein [Fusobacterium necrophorum subsp. funduliforme]EFS23246.1 oligopeptide ABC transporter, ATP-binding protein AppF [Fusobacterium necrophorum D12]EJU15309.1 oligopeptide/dipeptide transporter, C-terminal domain protein [Fusobacterium necrophorum subsp. funduliforme Fnf 1007]KDE62131.1 peptide ABC transporter ATP-binding protein [Fusobacterium necrophor
MENKVLLEVKNLKKYFQTPKGPLHAVDGVNFSIEEGKTLGVVGESGCGKSTTGRVILRLLEATDGEILFEGKNIREYSKAEMNKLRQEMQIIFQDPFASLNPRMTVSEIIAEPLIIHKKCRNKKELEERVLELMETVGLSERLINTYPHELDGGRRQRIGIARALALKPKFIVCDEPVSALDVSIQAQVLNLMQDLQEKLGLTYMFITHDLSVVKHFSDDIAVMYLGELVEKAPSKELFRNPIHPYTKALLSAIPSTNIRNKMERIRLEGEITSPINPEPGCRFAKRCVYAQDICRKESPKLQEVQGDHFFACHRAEELDFIK